MGVGRHRQIRGRQGSGTYQGAGKRKRVSATHGSSGYGRHRSGSPTPLVRLNAVPRHAVALAVVGMLGGGVGASEPAASTYASAAPAAANPRARLPEARDLAVSRSGSRSPSAASARRVERAADARAKTLTRLERRAAREAARREAERWVLPVASYRLTGTFGERSSLWSTVHTGLDFATALGTPIHAIAAGVVTDTGWAGAYGYRTIVELPDGTQIWYCHQSRIEIETGAAVDRGQEIGTVGSTGNSTGPHVHIEVRPAGGEPVDPKTAFAAHGAHP